MVWAVEGPLEVRAGDGDAVEGWRLGNVEGLPVELDGYESASPGGARERRRRRRGHDARRRGADRLVRSGLRRLASGLMPGEPARLLPACEEESSLSSSLSSLSSSSEMTALGCSAGASSPDSPPNRAPSERASSARRPSELRVGELGEEKDRPWALELCCER